MHPCLPLSLSKLKWLACVAAVTSNTLGCATTPTPSAEGPVLEAATDEMIPHFECVLLFDQLKKSDKVSRGIDTASTIGEREGLSPSQIMRVYRVAKDQALERVLEQAIKNAANDENRLPRLDGSAPRPEPDDELKAWKDLYEPQCNDELAS